MKMIFIFELHPPNNARYLCLGYIYSNHFCLWFSIWFFDIWGLKSYSDRRGPQGVMPGRLHLPRSLYEFSVSDFPYVFRHRRWSWATTHVYNSYGHRTISYSGFLRCSVRRVSADLKLKSYGVRAMSVRSPYNFWLSPCGLPMISVRS